MNYESNKSGEKIFEIVMSLSSLIISGVGLFEVSRTSGSYANILLIAFILLFVLSCIFVVLKQHVLVTCVVVILTILFLVLKFEPQIDDPPASGPVASTPIDFNDTEPTEMIKDTPAVKDTEPKLNIDFAVYCKENYETTAQLGVSGETAGLKPRWYSSNPGVVEVNSKGKITANDTGKATIYAEIQYDGYTYSEEIEVSVDYVAVDERYYSINYVESLPSGIDSGNWSYKSLVNSNDIYNSEYDGIGTIKETYYAINRAASKLGYIYYHWCRGEYNNPDLEIVESHVNDGYPYYYNHNRGSDKEKTDAFRSFTCFFSNEEPSLACKDGSGCYWYESPGICNDSYWYWAVPVYQAEYIGYNAELHITVNN